MSELDLRETLARRIDGADVPPGDPWAAVARGRRLRRRLSVRPPDEPGIMSTDDLQGSI